MLSDKHYYSRDDMYQIIQHLQDKISDYEKGIAEGSIIILPCKLGDSIYVVYGRYTECSKGKSKYNPACTYCDKLRSNCDSQYEYYIKEEVATSIDWIIRKLIHRDDRDGIAFLSIEDACACAAEYNSCIYSNSEIIDMNTYDDSTDPDSQTVNISKISTPFKWKSFKQWMYKSLCIDMV